MEIRDFKNEDLLDYLAFSNDFYSGGATLHPVDEKNFKRTFEACIEGNPYTRGLMLVENGKSIGYSLLSFTWSNEVGGPSVLFEELYLAPDHRGASHGSEFIKWLLEEYFDAFRIRLEVCTDNLGARRLYERLGFTELGYMQMIRDRQF